MTRLTVLYDACVLYSAPLRDFLMQLALTDLFHAKWSADIHEEWIRSVLAARLDLTRERLERTRRLMDSYVRDCLVEGYEPLIESIVLPDLDDRHVLAAAVTGEATLIVTFNLSDFPEAALRPYGVEAWHPDGYAIPILGHQESLIFVAQAAVVFFGSASRRATAITSALPVARKLGIKAIAA